MKDTSKTNQELIEENFFLRQRLQELQQAELEVKRTEEALLESESLQGTLLANLPAGVIIIDPVTRIIENVNTAAAAMFGMQREHIIGHRCHAFLCPASEGACPVCDLGKEVDNAEREMICADGRRLPILKSVKRVQIRDQEKLLECFVDITTQKQSEEALRESEKQYRELIDGMNETVWVIDFNGDLIDVNNTAVEFSGYSKEELLTMGLYGIDSSLKKDDIKALANSMPSDKIQIFETSHTTKDGRTFPVEVYSSIVTYQGKQAILSIARNITKRRRMEEALRESEQRYRELSIVDALTQLYNSRHFYQQLKIELGRSNRYEQPLTLIMLDLDNFKAFNDTFGHVEGDQVLSRLGQVMKRCLRKTDSGYRYGGEEFTIILPMTTTEDGAVVAERIRKEFKKETFSLAEDQDIHMTVSIGLAQYKRQEDMKAFVHRVDQLMYQGKKNGKDQVCCEPYHQEQFIG